MTVRLKIAFFVIVCVVQPVAVLLAVPPVPSTYYKLVDDFSYSQQFAQTAWQPMSGSKSVSIVDIGGGRALKMPCNFRGTKIERAAAACSLCSTARMHRPCLVLIFTSTAAADGTQLDSMHPARTNGA